MSHSDLDEPSVTDIRLAPPSPVVIWGALMMVALFAAGATTLIARNGGGERVVVAGDGEGLRREVVALADQRNQLLDRVNRLERSFGELKLATRASEVDVTGSIGHGRERAQSEGFALSLGPDVSIDAVRRRWSALVARYPQALAQLSGRAAKAANDQGVYDLVAGPFPTRPDAERACTTLADQGFPCDTTIFAGEPLTTP